MARSSENMEANWHRTWQILWGSAAPHATGGARPSSQTGPHICSTGSHGGHDRLVHSRHMHRFTLLVFRDRAGTCQWQARLGRTRLFSADSHFGFVLLRHLVWCILPFVWQVVCASKRTFPSCPALLRKNFSLSII